MPKSKNKKRSRSGDLYSKEEPNPVNRFENDGSFMEMFRKMAEQSQQAQQQQQHQQYQYHYPTPSNQTTTADPTTSSESAPPEEKKPDELYVAPQAVTYKSGPGDYRKPQQGLVGKRKNLMKSAELREKRKKHQEAKEEQQGADQEGQKSSAWKTYMAEVKAYEAMKCGDSEEHKRPLVK